MSKENRFIINFDMPIKPYEITYDARRNFRRVKKVGLPIIEDTTIKGWKLFQKTFFKIKIQMKFEHTTKGFRNNVFWNDFPYMKIVTVESLDPRTLKACYFHANTDIF